jgi:hypothetical protein
MVGTNFNWTNVTTISQILVAPNTNTGGWFWAGMLFLIFLVVFIILLMKEVNIEAALLASGFVGFTVSLMMTYMNLVRWEYCLFFIGLLIVLIIYIIYSTRRDEY